MAFVQKRIQDQASGFGADLRELRELRGYSREALSKISGIHQVMIAALEDERCEDLTDPTYVERHIRRLVRVLEGRTDSVLHKYQELLQARQLTHAPAPTLRPNVRKRDLFVSSRLFVFLGFLAVVSAVGLYVLLQARQISSAPLLMVVSPLEGQTTSSSHVTIVGSTDPGATVLVNGQMAIVDSNGKFQTVIDVASGVSTIQIEARRRYSQPTTIERHLFFQRITSSSSTQTATSSDQE